MFCVRQSTNIFLKLLYLSLCVYLDKYHEVLFKKKKKTKSLSKYNDDQIFES